MLYKVTPMMAPPQKAKPKLDPDAPREPRKRRKSAVYDADGNEVLITMMCLKCRSMKPLVMFGLRKMADGAIRNQPWCRGCRSGASSKKKPAAEEAVPAAPQTPAVQLAQPATPPQADGAAVAVLPEATPQPLPAPAASPAAYASGQHAEPAEAKDAPAALPLPEAAEPIGL